MAVGCGEAALLRPALRSLRPEVLVVDSRMEGALELCAALKHEGGPAVVLIAAEACDAWLIRALRAGARGVLTKGARAEDLIKAVRVVHEGQIWAPRQLMAEWAAQVATSPGVPPGEAMCERLTSRETEIFRYAAGGLSNKEMADRLAISLATVKVHLSHIFQKLGLRGRTGLAAAYHGLADGPTTKGLGEDRNRAQK